VIVAVGELVAVLGGGRVALGGAVGGVRRGNTEVSVGGNVCWSSPR
jgi:hypothetical protein